MREIIIIGSGGHGAELDDYIKYNNQSDKENGLKVIGFLDDDPASYARYQLSGPLLGGVKDHKIRTDVHYLMGIANLSYRRYFVDLFSSKGASFISFIHKTAYISESATIGSGAIIGPMVNIGPNVKIGDFSLLNSRTSMGHDTIIGKFNFISPNVCFSGFTHVGDQNLFGINSATIPGIQVGTRNKIMAGMVLDKNVGDDEVVFFRFKEKILAIPK